MESAVGVHGVGLYLPPIVRTNDYWPAATVERWVAERRNQPPPPPPRTEAERLVYEALRVQAQDPFQNAVARHVIPDDMSHVDMEERAAVAALARAHIDRDQIDLLLTHRVVPEFLMGNPACQLHERLQLRHECFAMHMDAASYSFIMQMCIAETMIRAGRASHALLVQSSAPSRTFDYEDPGSPIIGDGATAVVMAPSGPGRGIVATVHYVDGRFPKTLIASVPGKRWFDEGKGLIHVADVPQMKAVFMRTVDACKDSVESVLHKAGWTPDQVDYLSMFQGTPWLREVVRETLHCTRARCVETFSRTGYLASALIPASLALADQEGALHDGDAVVLTGGGTGMTFGAIALRWGP